MLNPMYREGTQASAAPEPAQDEHEAEAGREDHAHFHGGPVPGVGADQTAPPQPTASEQAFGGHRPVAVADPTALTAPVRRVVHGIVIIAPTGAHAAAVEQCAQIVQLEIGRNRYAQNKLREAKTTIVIIPARMPMTDISPFDSLRGQRTFDGRDWSTVRGSGGTRGADGTTAIGVAEENLITLPGVRSSYPTGYSIGIHEFAHILEGMGLTRAQKGRLEQLFAQRRRADPGNAGNTFTDDYAASNMREYFAQSTNAFFGKNAGGTAREPNHNGREWLRTQDPDMYAFLVELYERDRDEDGDVVQRERAVRA
jgi:serralysin